MYNATLLIGEKMSEYVLSKKNYELLKNISLAELADEIVLDDKSQKVMLGEKPVDGTFEGDVTQKMSAFKLLLLIVDDEITDKGLNEDQNLCTEYGRQLCSLYDELLALREEETR